MLLVVALAWVLFVPAADWLARHDIGHATGSTLETARNNARGNLLALAAGLAGFGALLFTARNFALQRRSLELSQRTFEENAELARRTLELTEQGQVTDRYTKAIEQLGSDTLDIRIGGIYGLERIARDSARDHPAIMEVLSTFIRGHGRFPNQASAEDRARNPMLIGTDIQAALSVIGRRNRENDIRPIGLYGANFTGARLADAHLANADLNHAHLHHAYLRDATLNSAILTEADLTGANLRSANLTGAILSGTDLADSDLTDASLAGADLTDADLTSADLTDANLTSASLTGANLNSTILVRANLNGAILNGATLNGADLTGARMGKHPAPAGWRVDAWGGLERNHSSGQPGDESPAADVR